MAAATAAQIMALHQDFLAQARPYYGQPWNSVNFGTAAGNSQQIRIPNAMLLAKTFLLVSGTMSVSIPATSDTGLTVEGFYALIPNVQQSVGLSAKPVDCSAHFLQTEVGMDYPQYEDTANMVILDSGVPAVFPISNTTGAAVVHNLTYSFVVEVANIYSEAGLQSLILMQNQKVAGNYVVSWLGSGTPQNIFTKVSGTAATITNLTGTVQFASELYPVPSDPTQGAPDLTRYVIKNETQYPIANSKAIVNIDPGLEILRVIIHLVNGTTGVIDEGNALGLEQIKWSWNGGAVSQIDTVTGVLTYLGQRRYAPFVVNQLGNGVYILDFDRQAPREWFNSTGVTDLKLQFTFGSTPPTETVANILIESMLDISQPTS